MKRYLTGIGVVISLELRQRVRSIAWYVLIGISGVLVGLVTLAAWVITQSFDNSGGPLYSTVIYFVLLLATLVAPALSGNAINGDRDAGTLATVQVTLATTSQIVLGKFIAAWITALTFLAISAPALIISSFFGGLDARTVVVSIALLAAELGVVAAVGVGLSGLIDRPILSIVTTYLFVAAISVGTLIAFALLGLAAQTPVSSTYISAEYDSNGNPTGTCAPPETTTYNSPHFEYFWGILAANPYVLVADAAATSYSNYGDPQDLFGYISYGARSAQIAIPTETVYDYCHENGYNGEYAAPDTAVEVNAKTVPSWFVGLALHLLFAAGALVGAWARIRTPLRSLGKGTRVA